jgi:hypothetical protein
MIAHFHPARDRFLALSAPGQILPRVRKSGGGDSSIAPRAMKELLLYQLFQRQHS